MSPDEIHSTVDSIYSQHLAANPPGMPAAPQPDMQQSTLGRLWGGPADAPSNFNKVPQSIQNAPDSTGQAIGAVTLGGLGALGAAQIPGVSRVAGAAVKMAPYIAASEGINLARQHLPLGKYIPPGSELLPFFLAGGKGGSQAEAGTAAEAEAATAPTQARKVTGPALESQLRDSLGGAEPLKPNVPLRQQLPATAAKAIPQGMTPVESSSVLKAFKYNPTSQEMEVVTHSGTHYIYGDVDPEQAQAFVNSDSAGQAWNQLRQSGSTLVAKVVNGKRIAVKPSIRSATPNLADLLGTQ
jgi:KTSC domain